MKLYTVDRAGTLKEGQILALTKDDPTGRPFIELPDLFTKNELAQHILELFLGGLSIHGWHYLKQRHTFGTNPNFT